MLVCWGGGGGNMFVRIIDKYSNSQTYIPISALPENI